MNIINQLFLRGVHREVAAENDMLRTMLRDSFDEARDMQHILKVRMAEIVELSAQRVDDNARICALNAQVNRLRTERLRAENDQFSAMYFEPAN